MSPNAEIILKEHKLRVTNCRKDVLETFARKQSAMSHADLEEILQRDHDRVTIYRTLKTFLESDLIHKVLDDSGATKYALCSHTHENGHHHDHDHVHFKCEKCGKTKCIEEAVLPKITLPNGFVNKEVSLLVTGVCDECN
ncbi:Zinc uptake regulation protein ZUR [Indibacter alkaliphilus LW1]|jgi:Fur family ferric uptake transcriptional regulator|uniref:Zinc uptake regulation protein ZUR n=1 Tax=Indibacter alkaliphilus (strain CCUG 57479 / KCTC 22604 / LW1) TaxID=1189612 RepID=S2CZM1_INDAL|nr:transcriptional repressor [Indibacter alkaliphilus]EOZ92049.1 Zinc uptake regulation protein ZUR [Indibacter alkaliphilus LW1]